MSKYKKPKVGFLDHVDGKTGNETSPIDDVLNEAKDNPAPQPEPKVEKKPVITEEKKPSADGMSSYVKATKVDPNSAKGAFDDKAVEGYVPPILEEKKPEVDPQKMSAYKKAVHERSVKEKKKLQEAAELLGGEPEKPVTQADLKQMKVALASLGGGGLGERDVLRLIKEYAGDSAGSALTPEQIQQIIDAIDPLDDTDDLSEGTANLYYTEDRFDASFDTKTTNDLPEGTDGSATFGTNNQYFTAERARASIQSIDSALVFDQVSGNLELNTNAFDTYNSDDFDSDLASKTTGDLTEGNNLYYTDSRVSSLVDSDYINARVDLPDDLISDSSDVTSIIDSDYINARVDLPDDLISDSSDVTSIIDSDYINARVETQVLEDTDSLPEGSVNLYYTDSRARSAIQSVDSSLIYDSTTGNFSLAIDPDDFYITVDFDSDFLNKTTDSLAEGSDNLYYTEERVEELVDSAYVNARVDLPKTTDSLPEGLTNLYYTTARFDSDAAGINSKLDSLEDRLDSDDIEIQNLKNTVEQLELSSALQIKYDKILSYDSATDSVEVGTYGLHFDGAGTEYNNIDKLFLHHTDRNGVHVPFGIIDSGDTILIADSDGGVGRFRVDAFEDRGNHHEFDVSVQAGQGAPADLAAMNVYPEQNLNSLASMDYVDAQDKVLQDQIDDLDTALDSEHAWNVSEHEAESLARSTGDSYLGALILSSASTAVDLINALDSNTSSSLDSEHAWNIAEHSALSTKIDSEHAWNITEHSKLDSDISESFDSEHAWNISEHDKISSNLDSEHAWNLSEHSKLDSQIDSDHTWAVNKFISLDSAYVNVTGDTMTGTLSIDSGDLQINYGTLTVKGGNIRATEDGKVVSNKVSSLGNSNLQLERNGERKLLLGDNALTADKKIKYNTGYNRDSYTSDLAGEDSYTLMPKWYVDSAVATASFSVDSDLFVSTDGDTMFGQLFMDSAPIVLKNSVGTAKVLKTQQGSAAETLSILATGEMNWTNDGVATLNKTGGDMTFSIDDIPYMQIDQSGTEIDFFKGIKLNDPERSIDVASGEYGKLKYSGSTKMMWGNEKVEIEVPLLLAADPTNPLEAATKAYVDDAIASGGGGSAPTNVIINDGSTQVTTDFRILGDSKTFISTSNNELAIYNLKAPTSSHHAASKGYVDDNFVALTGDQAVAGKKTFLANTYVEGYLYLSKSSTYASGVLRRDTIEAMIAASGGGDYKITKSGSNYYIEST